MLESGRDLCFGARTTSRGTAARITCGASRPLHHAFGSSRQRGKRPTRSHVSAIGSVPQLCAEQQCMQPSSYNIRLATLQDYWPAADMHCATFYSDVAGSLQAKLARVDRIMALQVNDALQRRKAGR